MGDPIVWILVVVLLGLVVVAAMLYARSRSGDQALRPEVPLTAHPDRDGSAGRTIATPTSMARHQQEQAPATTEASRASQQAQGDGADAPSLYARLGGAPAVTSVVDDFYRRVLGDDSLKPVFEGVDMTELRKHQTLFMTYALGGPNQYAGRRIARAHEGLAITEAQFGAVAGHLSASLAAHDVPQPLIDEVIGKVAALQPEVVGR